MSSQYPILHEYLHLLISVCNAVCFFRLLLENGADVVALNNDCCIPLDICKNPEIKELFIQEINGRGTVYELQGISVNILSSC